MPAVLDPKAVSKQEEFVEKQIETARRRIRTLDWFAAGLWLAIASLALLLTVLLVDRYVETPAGTGWAVLGLYIAGVAGYLYWSLFRVSRRQINPFYAAHQVELTIPDAKNSVVNYVDLKDDGHVPGSVKAAIGVRAAKDLKHVDLNQVIQKKQILWLAGLAGVFLVASIVAAALPPTRTTLAIVLPKDGSTAITQGEDLRIEAEVRGRVPGKSDPDAAVARLWYNPDDDTAYEDRPLEAVQDKKNVFGVTIPARQMRNGFRYQVRGGNAATPIYTIKLNITPQFTGWLVEYDYPAYLNRDPAKSDNQNLVGFYGTTVTVTAFTNRPVKSGVITIDGQLEPVIGQLIDDNPEAIRFRFPMMKSSNYRVRFMTTEGLPNPEPLPKYRISLLDPVPTFLNFDVTYDYPKYLRAEKVTVTQRQPNLEAMRGTKVTLVGHANRPIKEAVIDFPGTGKVVGVVDPKTPTEATFTLPPMLQDGDYRVVFTPKTDEGASKGEVYKVRVLTDEIPKIEITKPAQEVEIPANGILTVEGIASDDIGLDRINLRMEVKSPQPMVLAPKPYRGGMSFKREADNSYPTRVEYKDFVELSKLKPEGVAGAGFQIKEGMVIQYWLEAIDNCDVPPGPNSAISQKQTVKVLPPETAEDRRRKQQQDQAKAEQDRKQHEQQQDQRNANEKRDPKQPQPQGDPQPKQGNPQQGDPQPKQGDPQKKDGNGGQPMQGDPQPMPGDPNGQNAQPMDDPNLQDQLAKVKDALPNKGNDAPKDPMGKQPDDVAKDNPAKGDPMSDKKDVAKGDPGKGDPMGDKKDVAKGGKDGDPMGDKKDVAKGGKETGDPKSGTGAAKDGKDVAKNNPPEKIEPMPRPKDGMGDETAPKPESLPGLDDFEKLADKLNSEDKKEREEAREQIKQMTEQAKKNPTKPEEQQKRLDEHRKEMTQDQKRRFDDAMKDIQQEMRQQQAEEQAKNDREERVKKAADKAMSNDPKDREQGQKDLERELQNQNTRDDVDRQLQNMASGQSDPDKKKKLEDAHNLSRNNTKKQADPGSGANEPPPPKKEENDVDRLAKKVQKGTEDEKKDAEDKLQKKLEDPKTREQVQKQLDDIRDNIKDEQAKKNFDQAMQKVKDQAKKNEPPTPDDVRKMADRLTSEDKNERDQAKQDLEQAMKKADKFPQAKEDARKQLDQARKDIKDDAKREQFDKSMEQVGKAVDEQRKENQAKADAERKQEADQLAKDLTSNNQAKKEAAEEKLKEVLKDPAKQEQLKKDLADATKNNADKQQAVNDAVKKADEENRAEAKDTEQKKNDAQQVAKDLAGKDADKQAAAQKKLDQMMKDPKSRDAAREQMEEFKKQNPGSEQAIDNAMKKADQATAKSDPKSPKKDGDAPSPEQIEKLANALKSDDPAVRDVIKKKIEEQMKKLEDNPQAQKNLQKQLEQARESIQDPKKREQFDKDVKDIADNMQKFGEEVVKDRTAKAAKDLQSKDPAKQQAAREELEKMLNDPAKEQLARKALDDAKKDTDAAGKQAINDATKKIDDKIAGEQKKDAERKVAEEKVKEEVNKLAEKLDKGMEGDKQQARDQLKQMLRKNDERPVVEKELDEFLKDIKDGQAREQFAKEIQKLNDELAKTDSDGQGNKVDLTKTEGKKSGDTPDRESAPGTLPDLKNRLKAGELVLDEFKKNMNKDEFRQKLDWTPEQMADFERRMAKQLEAMRKQVDLAEKGDLPVPRLTGPSILDKAGPERVNLDAKDSGPTNAGGKFIAPPGFGDPYGRFTDEVSGKRPAKK